MRRHALHGTRPCGAISLLWKAVVRGSMHRAHGTSDEGRGEGRRRRPRSHEVSGPPQTALGHPVPRPVAAKGGRERQRGSRPLAQSSRVGAAHQTTARSAGGESLPPLRVQLHGRRNEHPACSRAEMREIIMPLLHSEPSKTERFLTKRSRPYSSDANQSISDAPGGVAVAQRSVSWLAEVGRRRARCGRERGR